MNLRLIVCIFMGVFTTYIGVFMLFTQLKTRGRLSAPPPKPNFFARSSVVVDSATGEKTIYREITVSTKFAPPPANAPEVKPALSEAQIEEIAARRE